MVALPLFDVVMSSGRAERAIHMAEQLADGALAELRQIQLIEESLAPADLTHFDRPTAALIRGMYEQWAHETESLLDRIRQAESRFGAVSRTEELRDALGRTLSMLSVSLDDMEAGRREIAEGRVLSAQEVRRELRLSAQ